MRLCNMQFCSVIVECYYDKKRVVKRRRAGARTGVGVMILQLPIPVFLGQTENFWLLFYFSLA
jgi:hypothetical protein